MVKIAEHLEEGIFIARPNRFVGEIELDGRRELCHILNPGRMQTFLKPGVPVLVENRANPKRKLAYSLVFVKLPSTLVLIDTQVPNAVMFEALQNQVIPEFRHICDIKPEQRYGSTGKSRIDFLLDGHIFVEVKSSNYSEGSIGAFPDAPSERAQRHVTELIWTLKNVPYAEVWVAFLGQRTDISEIRPLDKIDPLFGRLLREGVKQGLKIIAFQLEFLKNGQEVILGKRLPVVL